MAPSRTRQDRTFSGDRKAAWEGFLHCQSALIQLLARELDQAGEIPLSTYDILVQLSEAGGRLRLRDLVDRVVLSQPGLSRKVARLEQDGLLDRLPDPSDGRGVQVKITRSGRAALRNAARVHLSGIERTFASRIDDNEAAVLAAVFDRLLAELNGGEHRNPSVDRATNNGEPTAAAHRARTGRPGAASPDSSARAGSGGRSNDRRRAGGTGGTGGAKK